MSCYALGYPSFLNFDASYIAWNQCVREMCKLATLLHHHQVKAVHAKFRTHTCMGLHCRRISETRVSRKREAMAYFSIESALALVLSLLINIWVISVFARGFHGSDNVAIGLENAGHYLGQRFGQHMKYIWAVGLLAAGGHLDALRVSCGTSLEQISCCRLALHTPGTGCISSAALPFGICCVAQAAVPVLKALRMASRLCRMS